MPLFARRRGTRPLSERVFRIRKMGYLRRNLEEGKEEYASALKEKNDTIKMREKLLAEREKFSRTRPNTPESKEMLARMNIIIEGYNDMIQMAIRTQQRAKEMILHAEKELGILSVVRRAKKAA
ncbi:MAG: hypothetical protein FJY86_02000 [Candidatus Diapherotrites archaeon]|uniref:Uncharacterized protein n=1 Tax=Candidatus Iainarchaeum sp. TaxID=3101447 RepID=A0A8T4C6C2_9ARCH|nr:hypothetical protein [Candidatus Diapherotrites archaeon]